MAARTDPLADPELAIRRVYAYVAYRIGDGAIAEDVTSATIERALRYRSSYNPRKGEPIAWLLGIARRELETGYREVANATEVRVEEDQGRVESFDDAVLGRVSAGQLVGKLPPRDRELLALRFGADLSARQIAKEIGMKPNAVEVAIHRALERLRDVVSPKVAVPASAVIDLDPATHEASALGGETVRLSNREFALLEALLTRPGAILSRSELESRIYGWGEEVESNAVEYLIHAVRKRLGADLILNVRGVGWMVTKSI